MLAIRMQRTGRKGHAQYRVVVQDSRRTPSSGKVVYSLGSYNPHTKETIIDKEKAEFYLKNGAQPSERVTSVLQKEGVKLPEWVNAVKQKESTTRNPEKLRKNQPKTEPSAEETQDAVSPDSSEEKPEESAN
jgi:small subunit ribosomal protein S16